LTKIETIARDIVAEWLVMFDPPPQIDFQQSEMLQASIAAALRARPAQEPTREQIARCIDPRAWNDIQMLRRDLRQKDAFEKADAIIALTGEFDKPIIGGTNFCGHGVMAAVCPTCAQSSAQREESK
jgi:hypothetical protein